MNDTELKNENSINILIVDDEDTILDILSTGFNLSWIEVWVVLIAS